MSDVAKELRASYERCKFWPERTEEGMMALLEMRNAGIRAADEIERLRGQLEKWQNIARARLEQIEVERGAYRSLLADYERCG